MSDQQLPERFLVLEELSRDRVGSLLRAFDRRDQREVMLEFPTAETCELFAETAQHGRLMREAKLLGRIDHPGVHRLLEVVASDGCLALVLESVQGEPLADILERRGSLDPGEVQALGEQLCDAVESMHRAGIVHRAISEANVLITADGSPVLTGSIFAKPPAGGDSDSTAAVDCTKVMAAVERAQWTALPAYPSPEHLAGYATDARSDIYGLGCVLYRCLTGRSPMSEKTPERWTEPEDPARLARRAPKSLTAAIRKCLARSPMGRFQTAAELAVALRARSRAVDRPRIALGIAAAAAVLVMGLWFAWDARGVTSDSTDRFVSRGRPVESGASRSRVAAPARYPASWALLVGIGYVGAQFPQLPNAESDVDAIAARLEGLGWSPDRVRRLTGAQATEDNIKRELSRLESSPGIDDQVFVYFAGHGIRHDGGKSGWAIPYDAAPADDSARSHWISFGELVEFFRRCRSRHALLALDCCYSGLALEVPRGQTAQGSDLARHLEVKAHKIIASSWPTQTASDGIAGTHSPFAQVFLDELTPGQEPLLSSALYEAVKQRFRDRELGHEPIYGHVTGTPLRSDFVFFR